jgi:hypothetical protein
MIVPLILLIVLIALLGYTVFILYKKPAVAPKAEGKEQPVQHQAPPPPKADPPFSTGVIRDLDDYEYAAVFENEAPRELTQEMRNRLQSQRPMDWSSNPPSSSAFQKGLEAFQDASGGSANADLVSPYAATEDASIQPPDTQSLEQQERQILQTYTPKHAGDLVTYNIEDAQELIKKIYAIKGEIPQIVQKPNNVFEVVGTTKKDEKIIYEETDSSAPASTSGVELAGEDTVDVPQAAVDKNAALDPFYEVSPDSSTRQKKWSFREWTPGLERMFAPTEDRTNWY